MYYTYTLKETTTNHFYVGSTRNLRKRLTSHKLGLTKSTKGRTWELYCYCAFSKEKTCRKFEKYLKSGSGRVFSKRHFGF